jgi:hypothetical protein
LPRAAGCVDRFYNVGMEAIEWTIAPRRRVIPPGEEDAARARAVDLLWNDPAQARAEVLTQRLQYWKQRESDLTQAIQRTQTAGKRARTRYGWELEELYSNLDGVREALRALEGELAACGVKLSGPSQPPTGSGGGRQRRRKRRRVVGEQGRGRRRRAVAAAG